MNGRPRSGPLDRNMQITRATFKQALRRCKESESKAHADSLARKLLMKDTKSFWAEIKRLNGKSSAPIASTIGNCTGPNAIAEQWKKSLQQHSKFGTSRMTLQRHYLASRINYIL